MQAATKRRTRLRALLACAVALAGCKAGTDQSLTPMTRSTHLAFFPVEAGGHAADCDLCHGAFPTFTQFTCFGCHDHDQARVDPVHANVAGYAYASAACYGCHRDPTAVPPPAGVVHDPARVVTLTALVPSYAGTSIASVTPSVESLRMGMDHATGQLPGLDVAACGTCHAGANAGIFYPGVLHSSLANAALAQPSSCSDCHAVSAPTGLVGPLATTPARKPPSGEMKHDAVAWANGAPTPARLVTSDCGVCHVSPSAAAPATWATGQGGAGGALFHASLDAARAPQPGSCLDCHANSRPAAVLAAPGAALPPGVTFDHASGPALADCSGCHPSWASWSGGRLHAAGSATPATCLPCHQGERPTSTAAWASATYAASPFDYVTNAAHVTHGDGLDCVACHAGPGGGAWGGTQDWRGGRFAHGAGTVAATTCLACHMSQRPDLQPGADPAAVAALLGFDHARDGTGDCFGCHQATVAAGRYVDYLNPATRALPGGDWQGGQSYPGSTLIGSPTQLHSLTELALTRAATGLVTGMTSSTATLYDQMLHVSTAIPPELSAGPSGAPDRSKCWHCHQSTNGVVTAYAEGRFHASLASYSATPGGAVTPLPQPTSRCSDCHVNARPIGIVERSGSDLQPMDHRAAFTAAVTLGGVTVLGVGDMDCAPCHASPTTTWADGVFHAAIGSAVPQDCTACHYPLMVDAAADAASGTRYRMAHGSAQVPFQACQRCHATALSASTRTPAQASLWQTGALHASLPSQPGACLDCHAGSEPATATQSSVVYALSGGGTSSNGAQWMNHGSSLVAGDCAACHAADAKPAGSAWSRSASFHAAVAAPRTCQECHGLTNGGGAAAGTNNNLPAGLTNSSTVSTAGQDPTTGVAAGTLDQISHADVNVSGHDCSFCHTQAGVSTAPGVAGQEWAQARFHASFGAATTLVMNGSTGRCSNCHLNVKPGPGFTGQDHGALSAVAGTQDCSACHAWPGTGTSSSPNWLGASGGQPQYISVGGFAIPRPPAAAATTQAGIGNLPHPGTTGVPCATCHAGGAGGKHAIGYDHASTLIASNCNACHEAGSDLLGTPWNGAASQGAGAGDTRPYTLPSVVARRGTSGDTCTVTYANHFYPVDCHECHAKPAGDGLVTTGSAYTSAWTFPHQTTLMTNPGTCNMCHVAGCSK